MNAYGDEIARAVLEAARHRTRHLDGVSVNNAERDRNRTPTTVELEGTGWSPTLHAVRLRWTVELEKLQGVDVPALRQMRTAQDLFAGLREGMHHLADRVHELQHSRMTRAHALGIDTPRILPNDTSRMTPREIDEQVPIAHVMVDAVTIELMERWHRAQGLDAEPAALRRALVASLVDVLAEEQEDGETLSGMDAHGRFVNIRDCEGAGRLQPALPFVATDGSASFDGVTYWHWVLPPETALAALVGRPMRDLVETGTTLDTRIVRRAVIRGDRLCVGVEPADIRLSHVH